MARRYRSGAALLAALRRAWPGATDRG